MNKNYQNLTRYFITRNALNEKNAISLDGFSLEGVNQTELKNMIGMLDDTFHRRDDDKFWYEKKPSFVNPTARNVKRWIIEVIIIALTIVVLNKVF